MTFLDKISPSQYQLNALRITRNSDGTVNAAFEMRVFSATGEPVAHQSWNVTLTSSEQTTLQNFVTSHLTEFETETGLTRYTP